MLSACLPPIFSRVRPSRPIRSFAFFTKAVRGSLTAELTLRFVVPTLSLFLLSTSQPAHLQPPTPRFSLPREAVMSWCKVGGGE